MSNHPIAQLVTLEGPDAMAFAHAQFASDVASLISGHWQFSAWLDPQGRVRALFQLARLAEDHLILLLRGGAAEPFAEGLRRFQFRSKMRIGATAHQSLATGPALPLGEAQVRDGDVAFGCGDHSMRIAEGRGDRSWMPLQIPLGWPWLPSSTLDQLLAPSLSLQRLHAVAIDKGCYPGQEIVARLHFRGGQKRHLHRVEMSQHVMEGSVLRHQGREAGRLLQCVTSTQRHDALMVLSDDAAAAATGNRVQFDDGIEAQVLARWPA